MGRVARKHWLVGGALVVSLLLHLGASLSAVYYFDFPDVSSREDLQHVQLVDLVETANDIRPEQARHVGSRHNSTNHETVASPQRKQNQGKEGDRRQAAKSRATGQGNSAFQIPPATALFESMGPGFLSPIPEDYFQDYTRGAHTYLNVLRYPDVDYFVELKRSLKIAWDYRTPITANRGHPKVRTGRLITVVAAAVNAAGELAELFVARSSGLKAYDQEALRAFRVTYPTFPPGNEVMRKFRSNDGLVRMSWALVTTIR